jgi:hypothetical protein
MISEKDDVEVLVEDAKSKSTPKLAWYNWRIKRYGDGVCICQIASSQGRCGLRSRETLIEGVNASCDENRRNSHDVSN